MGKSKQERESISSLGIWLREKILEHRSEDDSSPISALELYQQFQVSGLDFKGQNSSGLGSYKGGLEVSAGVSLLPFPLPSSLLFGKVSAGITGSGSIGLCHLFVLQRQPSEIKLGQRDIYKTSSPICMLKLTGSSKSFQLKASVTANIGFSTIGAVGPIGPETLGASLVLSASAEAAADYNFTYLNLDDADLGYFSSPLNEGLIKFFEGFTNKRTLKDEASKWLINKKNRCESYKITGGVNSHTSTKEFIKHFERLKEIEYFYKQHKSAIDYYLKQFNDLESSSELKKKASNWLTNKKNRCESFKITGGVPNNTSAMEFIQLFERLMEIEYFYKQHKSTIDDYWKRFNQLVYGSDFKGLTPSTDCSLSLLGHKGTAGATGTGGGTLGPIDASGTLSIKGEIKHTSYRFQISSDINNKLNRNLIFTQDTVIDYRQVKLTGEAVATVMSKSSFNIDGDTPESIQRDFEERKKNAEQYLYNMMFYESACVYWFPNSIEEPLPGSGLCFGMSILIERVIALAENPDDNKNHNLMETICKKLMVEKSDIKKFLENFKKYSVFKEDISPESIKSIKTASILLESALTPPQGYKIKSNHSYRKPCPDDQLLKNMKKDHKSQPFTLQAIRARYRIADLKENKKTLFKLGITPPFVKLGINLSKVTEAGREGIVDLYTYWFGDLSSYNEDQNEQNINYGEAYEEAIPPVILFHQ
ncbi:MAG: hypothetical protein F6K54_20660 [Okeania sp. SIO3B5]|uniref:hypothetical protein n=1 Tax=Okeania sp. SIO3B5 TaxID=2607811 RepID=UPI001401B2C4|nr:hypothetical protein [Okeania sp. SIO3B5]NEO55268.1 hypothetical protein [Okeania sp. SIO3B5]